MVIRRGIFKKVVFLGLSVFLMVLGSVEAKKSKKRSQVLEDQVKALSNPQKTGQLYNTLMAMHQSAGKMELLEFSSYQDFKPNPQKYLKKGAKEGSVHIRQELLKQGVNDPSVSDEAFSALVLLYWNPMKILAHLLEKQPEETVNRLGLVRAFEEKNKLTGISVFVERHMLLKEIQGKGSDNALLKKEFPVSLNRLKYSNQMKAFLRDALLKAYYQGDKENVSRLREYVHIPHNLKSVLDYKFDTQAHTAGVKQRMDINQTPAFLKQVERLSNVIRFCRHSQRMPFWVKEYPQQMESLIAILFERGKNYSNNREAVEDLDFIANKYKVKISPEILVKKGFTTPGEYSRTISQILYFAAQRGFDEYLIVQGFLDKPGQIFMGNQQNKRALIDSCLSRTSQSTQNGARLRLNREVVVQRF